MEDYSHLPIQDLTLGQYSWEGTIVLTAWADYQRYLSKKIKLPVKGQLGLNINTPQAEDGTYGPINSKQWAAIEHVVKHQDAIRDAILEMLPPHYVSNRGHIPEEMGYCPPLSTLKGDFGKVIRATRLYVLDEYKDGLAYVGLGFECKWDPEHGMGVLIHGSEVIHIADETIAFEGAEYTVKEVEARAERMREWEAKNSPTEPAAPITPDPPTAPVTPAVPDAKPSDWLERKYRDKPQSKAPPPPKKKPWWKLF